MSIKIAFEYLEQWLVKNPDKLQLDGGTKSSVKHVYCFSVHGFLAEDYIVTSKDKLEDMNGIDFNSVRGLRTSNYGLAGDTKVEAIREFINLYKTHGGDSRKIFKLEHSDGAAHRRKLALSSGVVGWQCLGCSH